MKTKRMRHAETGAVYDAPASAVPMLVQSGWQELSEEDSAALDRQRRDEATATEAAMVEAAAKTLPPRPTSEAAPEFAPAPTPQPVTNEPAPSGRKNATKENS